MSLSDSCHFLVSVDCSLFVDYIETQWNQRASGELYQNNSQLS